MSDDGIPWSRPFPLHHSLVLGLQDLLTHALVDGGGGVLMGDLTAKGAVPGLGAASGCPPRGLAHCHHVPHQLHMRGRNRAALNTVIGLGLDIDRHTSIFIHRNRIVTFV